LNNVCSYSWSRYISYLDAEKLADMVGEDQGAEEEEDGDDEDAVAAAAASLKWRVKIPVQLAGSNIVAQLPSEDMVGRPSLSHSPCWKL
jgi:hypothetical protein